MIEQPRQAKRASVVPLTQSARVAGGRAVGSHSRTSRLRTPALPLVNAMSALLDLESPGVRAAAVRRLARLAHRAEDMALVDQLARTDEHPAVRVAATQAMATISSLAACERLISIARDGAQPDAVRGAAKQALHEGFVVPDDL